MKKTFSLFISLGLLFPLISFAQPNIDIVSFNSQRFVSNYSDSTKNNFTTQDNFFSVFVPVKFGNGHVFTIRLNAEQLSVSRQFSAYYDLYSVGLPVGLQLQSKNEKWKYTGIIIPKINSDFADNLDYDFQLGGIGLITRVFNEKLQVRADFITTGNIGEIFSCRCLVWIGKCMISLECTEPYRAITGLNIN